MSAMNYVDLGGDIGEAINLTPPLVPSAYLQNAFDYSHAQEWCVKDLDSYDMTFSMSYPWKPPEGWNVYAVHQLPAREVGQLPGLRFVLYR